MLGTTYRLPLVSTGIKGWEGTTSSKALSNRGGKRKAAEAGLDDEAGTGAATGSSRGSKRTAADAELDIEAEADASGSEHSIGSEHSSSRSSKKKKKKRKNSKKKKDKASTRSKAAEKAREQWGKAKAAEKARKQKEKANEAAANSRRKLATAVVDKIERQIVSFRSALAEPSCLHLPGSVRTSAKSSLDALEDVSLAENLGMFMNF